MADVAIRVEQLSKRYRLSALRYRPDSLREYVVEVLRSTLRRNGHGRRSGDDTLWALHDVSFEVPHSEVLGIIGRNGSGKSTLLKILTRITDPTSGRAEIYGRVGSLLEVGTGFDRDLTGRENIYLSGAILGMRRAEIQRKFDEIVAFSEVERFIDTPVKRYSSGMYVRLAFAVAAHLEPEILIVDEVLAVGDASFQEKCLAKMSDFGHAGRTVLFVSHNMSAITRLCHRAILLEGGRIVKDGPSHRVVNSYLNARALTSGSKEWLDPATAPRGRATRLHAVRLRNGAGRVTDGVDIREPIDLEIEYEVLEPGHLLLFALHFFNQEGVHLFSAHDLDPAWRKRPRPAGRYVSRVRVPGNFFSEGRHIVNVGVYRLQPSVTEYELPEVLAFGVFEGNESGLARGDYQGDMGGAIRPAFEWATQFTPASIELAPATSR